MKAHNSGHYILAKTSNCPLFINFLENQTLSCISIYIPKQTDVSVYLDIKRFHKTLNTTSRVRRWTQVPPFLWFIKFSIVTQFVKHHFLKYPIFMSKTTSLLKHMTIEQDQCRNEHSSCMTLVALGQNVKTYPTTQCKLLILKMGVPVFISASWMQFTELW